MSDEELRVLSERNPGWQFERLADGRLIVSPTGGESGRIRAAVLGPLYRWNEARDASTGFKLPDGSVLAPDAAFLLGKRWQALSQEAREGFPPLAPDAVFEVRSRSQGLEELREKAAWYLANGVRLVVLLDPYLHRVEVFRPGGVEGHQGPERVPLDPELPGFALETRGLFLP